MYQFPRYSARERFADALVHYLGLALAPAACVLLVVAAKRPMEPRLAAAMALYGLGLVAMITCSAMYNLAPPGRWKMRLRRLDHAAIFAMIAGTYTPVSLLALDGAWGWGLFVTVWIGALVGMAMKLVASLDREWASLAAYLALGWVAVVAIEPLLSALPSDDLRWLFAGGLLYSAGIVVHLSDRLPYHNAIWHAVVLLAAGCHFMVVLRLTSGA